MSISIKLSVNFKCQKLKKLVVPFTTAEEVKLYYLQNLNLSGRYCEKAEGRQSSRYRYPESCVWTQTQKEDPGR